MAEIINLNKVMAEKKDLDEGVFAVRQDDGDLKDLEDWNGEEWAELIDGVFASMAKKAGVSKWDVFADFMHQVLTET